MDFLTRIRCALILGGIAALIPVTTVFAQLSPGKLQKNHEALEGLSRCTQCHTLGKGVTSERCLTCHEPLRRRIEAGQGLHSNTGHENCINCHSDHQGPEYDMIRWPREQTEFPHHEVGYDLLQSHARLKCRDCHQAELIANADPLLRHGKDLDRTFLGLSTGCTDCHRDRHEGSLGRDCQRCHDAGVWTPAPGFDHAITSYPLGGKHEEVSCKKCHETAPHFLDLSFAQCSDCHKDPHIGDLGPNCAGCHTPASWADVATGGFDHSTTRFPLAGAHRDVTCKRCHLSGRSIANQLRCEQCHDATHEGVFANVSTHRTECDDCHNADRFVPSTYGLARHLDSRYPLTGAHRAVPCSDCHGPGGRRSRYRWSSFDCGSCHSDPHEKSYTRAVEGSESCSACHLTESWDEVRFAHDRTGYLLRDAHTEATCLDCHASFVREATRAFAMQSVAPLLAPLAAATAQESPAVEFDTWNEFREQVRVERAAVRRRAAIRDGDEPRPVLRLDDAPKSCNGCHADPHADQFTDGTDTPTVFCSTCHGTASWTVDSFNHETDARFSLLGGHEKVTCTECHRREVTGLQRFRPLGTECRDCHATEPSPER